MIACLSFYRGQQLAKWRERLETGVRTRRAQLAMDKTKFGGTVKGVSKLTSRQELELERLAQEVEAAALNYSPKGRVQREPHERNRPDLPSDAPANRAKRQIALSLPPPLIRQINAKCRKLGINRTAFIEYAIRQILKS